MFQLKQIPVKTHLAKNGNFFADILISKHISKISKTRLALLKKTCSGNKQTKPGFIAAARDEISNGFGKTKQTNY